jgi:hypothetical protein
LVINASTLKKLKPCIGVTSIEHQKSSKQSEKVKKKTKTNKQTNKKNNKTTPPEVIR